MDAHLASLVTARFQRAPADQCWEWTGSIHRSGYGKLKFGGKHLQAHRLVYELLRSEIPQGLVIDHLCRNPKCCNPDHLEPVTTRTNILRGIGKGAVAARATQCPQGHPYSGANLYLSPSGGRFCRTCNRLYAKRYARAKRQGESQ